MIYIIKWFLRKAMNNFSTLIILIPIFDIQTSWHHSFYLVPTDCFIDLSLTPNTFMIVLAVVGNKSDNFIRVSEVGG